MRPVHNKAHVASAPASVATNATQVLTFDTSGYDFANIKVIKGTHTTTSACFSTLKITESDTVTNAASQTAIVALTGGTATSTSVGFVVPSATQMAAGGVAVEFQVDLRNRKKYLGLSITPGQSMIVCAVADLTKDQSADTTTEKTESNIEATSVASCFKVVTD